MFRTFDVGMNGNVERGITAHEQDTLNWSQDHLCDTVLEWIKCDKFQVKHMCRVHARTKRGNEYVSVN